MAVCFKTYASDIMATDSRPRFNFVATAGFGRRPSIPYAELFRCNGGALIGLAAGVALSALRQQHVSSSGKVARIDYWRIAETAESPHNAATMSTDINQYQKLQKALITEKASIEARLAQISKVLGNGSSIAVSTPASQPGKRKFSAATKAKMRAAQKARWAKIKGVGASTATPKKRRKMSAAGKAAIRAAQKARWAKVKAQPAAPTTK